MFKTNVKKDWFIDPQSNTNCSIHRVKINNISACECVARYDIGWHESNKLTYLQEYLQSNRLRYNKSKCK